MRGSPLLRSILILLGLAVCGFGLLKLTAAPPVKAKQPSFQSILPSGEKVPVLGYELVLSARSSEVLINGSQLPVADLSSGTGLSGSLGKAADPRLVTLVVRWKIPPLPGEQRFAKLILYPPGKPTITHVFDAPGDIDDILELP